MASEPLRTVTGETVYFVKSRSQELVDSNGMAREIRKRINYPFKLTPAQRGRALAVALDPQWLRTRNGQTVGSVVRNARDVALTVYLEDK